MNWVEFDDEQDQKVMVDVSKVTWVDEASPTLTNIMFDNGNQLYVKNSFRTVKGRIQKAVDLANGFVPGKGEQ